MVKILLCLLRRMYNSVVHILPSLLPHINYYNYGRISVVFYTYNILPRVIAKQIYSMLYILLRTYTLSEVY